MTRWQDDVLHRGLMEDPVPVRRVTAGLHDVRFDGLADLLLRAHGRSVLDVGCNRGHTLYDFALNGASLVHGCDIFGPGMAAARQWFAEVRDCESRFEAIDLTKGPDSLSVFGGQRYDIVLMIGVYHKLKRGMPPELLSQLMVNLGQRTNEFFGFNGFADELGRIDIDMAAAGLQRIHTSEIGKLDCPSAIWRKT